MNNSLSEFKKRKINIPDKLVHSSGWNHKTKRIHQM